MVEIITHKIANIYIEPQADGRNRVRVELSANDLYMPFSTCTTSYPVGMIRHILEIKTPTYLCDEILRDESPDYVQKALHYDLLSYCDSEELKHKRLLDFGCGAGASTMIMARMFPYTEIVGVELDDALLSIARLRAQHYGSGNVAFLRSPNPESLPPGLGRFDYVVLSAVFEHLLPAERKTVLKQIWTLLKPGGILFLNQTPYRYFPVETHTTRLPLINYMPDKLAFVYAKFAAKSRVGEGDWNKLLRDGIRGGTVSEITRLLSSNGEAAALCEPSKLGIRDRIDLWYAQSDKTRRSSSKKLFLFMARTVKALTGASLLPYLSLAIAKQEFSGRKASETPVKPY